MTKIEMYELIKELYPTKEVIDFCNLEIEKMRTVKSTVNSTTPANHKKNFSRFFKNLPKSLDKSK